MTTPRSTRRRNAAERAADNAYQRERRRAKAARGECRTCRAAALPGKRLCERHTELSRAAKRRWRSRQQPGYRGGPKRRITERARYASDPEYRERRRAENRASYRRRQAAAAKEGHA